MEPFDLPADSGRMAVIADPSGAVLCVMQQQQHQGAQLVNEVGTWTWNQLATPDLDSARGFYGKVFDWSLEQSEEAPPSRPTRCGRPRGRGGRRESPERW